MNPVRHFQTAVFGGGCFWCLEAAFARLKGVRSVVSGYAGGETKRGKAPTYEDVSTGKTGHAETVKIDFDPQMISYKDLLSVFFSLHDPTTLNRQGADIGTQYRSVILFADDTQKEKAESFVEGLKDQKIYDRPIVTEIKPLEEFFPAEEYHQKYFEKNPGKAYCQINISPKIDKLRDKSEELLK